jgi:hypothetical protein
MRVLAASALVALGGSSTLMFRSQRRQASLLIHVRLMVVEFHLGR